MSPPDAQWSLPGYRIVSWHDPAAKDESHRVPVGTVRTLLRTWLSSRRRTLQRMDEAVAHGQPASTAGRQSGRHDDQLLQRLSEAFQSGKLVALRDQTPVAQTPAAHPAAKTPARGASVQGAASARATTGAAQQETVINQIGLVSWNGTTALRLRSSPTTQGNNILASLPFNTAVQVLSQLPGDWLHVSTRDGHMGYVAAQHVWFAPAHPLPEPRARLHRVIAGTDGTAIAIAIAEHYYGKAVQWGQDLRFYVNVLAAVNRISVPSSIDGWKSVRFQADHFIWIPSLEFARALRGRVSSGSYSHELTTLVTSILERVAQLYADLREAIRLSAQYLRAAITKHVEEALRSVLISLLQMAVGAALLLAITTAIGAAVGALAGGVGAAPGAAVGFEVGMALLEWLGLVFLVKWVTDSVSRIGSAFATFFHSVWNARGDRKKLDQAARELAEAIGVLLGVAVEALVMWAVSLGTEAALGKLRGTAFEKAFGESRLGSWLRERVKRYREGQTRVPGPREALTRVEAPRVARKLGISESHAATLLRVSDAATLETLKGEVGTAGLEHLARASSTVRETFFRQLREAGKDAAARARVVEKLRDDLFIERTRSRITAQPDKFKLTYSDAEMRAIVAKGKELGLSEHVTESFIYVGSRSAKAIRAAELMEQMENWSRVVSRRGYPYRFRSLAEFREFSGSLLEGLRKADLPTDDVRIQGSALRKPTANDVDVAVFVDVATFDRILIDRFDGRAGLKSGEKFSLKGKSHAELEKLAQDIEAHPDHYNAQAKTFQNALKNSIVSSKSDIVMALKAVAKDISARYPDLNLEAVSILLKKGLFDVPPDMPVKE